MPVIEYNLSLLMHAAAVACGALFVTASGVMSEAERLMVLCLAGGIGGGMLAVLLFPRGTLRLSAAKWIGSSMTSAIFGPAACVYAGIAMDAHYILAVSGAIGLGAWGFLILAVPAVQRIAARAMSALAREKFHLEDDDAKP